MEWAVSEDSPGDHLPALLPISWQKEADAMIEPRQKRMTLREYGGAVASLEDLPSEHQTTSAVNFGPDGWYLASDLESHYKKTYGGNPFILGSKLGFRPENSDLDLERISKGKLSSEHSYSSMCMCTSRIT